MRKLSDWQLSTKGPLILGFGAKRGSCQGGIKLRTVREAGLVTTGEKGKLPHSCAFQPGTIHTSLVPGIFCRNKTCTFRKQPTDIQD